MVAWGVATHIGCPVSARQQQPPWPVIPLKPGLTIVTAIATDAGDGESIKRVVGADGDRVDVAYSSEIIRSNPSAAVSGLLGGARASTARMTTERRVLRSDLRNARRYEPRFSPDGPVLLPGSTAVGTSSAVLADLKAHGEAAFTCACAPRGTVVGDKLGQGLDGLLGGTAAPLEMKYLDVTGTVDGRLTRVEKDPVRVAVIVNGRRVELPAIHATGRVGADQGDFYFLDDADNPLALRWHVGEQRLVVVKIAFPDELAAAIEGDLTRDGRAEVYGIYFETASASIKPESSLVLAEIAEALNRHATWRIEIGGHTDSIGGLAANLALSRRRAAAVKDALTGTYAVAPTRLTTAGFGASRPKATNDTLEGRALNRRVELIRR